MSIQSTGLSKSEKRGHASADVGDPLALIRKRELARLLKVNPWTIDNWRKRGLIPPPLVLSPQIVAWRRRTIERWLDERQAQPVVVMKKKRRMK